MNADRRVDGETACARFDAVLPELIGLDGEGSTMSTAEKEALLRHGETCSRCADTRRAYAATVDLLRGLPRKTAPSDFLSWVREELPETRGSAGSGRRSGRPWLALAAAVPVLAAAIYLASLSGKSPAPEIAMAPAPSASEPSRDLAAKAVLPAEPGAAIQELDAATDLDVARFDEAAPRSPPAEQKAQEKAEEMIVLALPYVAGTWETDVASLEQEVRGRFVDPARNAAPTARRRAPPSFGGPGGSSRPAPSEGVALEASKSLEDRPDPGSAERREVSAPAGAADTRAAAAAAAPPVREITLSLDPARLPELRSFVDRWSALRSRMQARGARSVELQVEEKLEVSPRQPVTVRIRIEPLLPASHDPKSP